MNKKITLYVLLALSLLVSLYGGISIYYKNKKLNTYESTNGYYKKVNNKDTYTFMAGDTVYTLSAEHESIFNEEDWSIKTIYYNKNNPEDFMLKSYGYESLVIAISLVFSFILLGELFPKIAYQMFSVDYVISGGALLYLIGIGNDDYSLHKLLDNNTFMSLFAILLIVMGIIIFLYETVNMNKQESKKEAVSHRLSLDLLGSLAFSIVCLISLITVKSIIIKITLLALLCAGAYLSVVFINAIVKKKTVDYLQSGYDAFMVFSLIALIGLNPYFIINYYENIINIFVMDLIFGFTMLFGYLAVDDKN